MLRHISISFLIFLFIPAPLYAQSNGLKLPPYKKFKLKNGMTVLLMAQSEVPLVSFNFIVRSGSVADPAGKEGLASLTAGLLRKGAGGRSADQISADLDFIGGRLSAGAGQDYSVCSAEFVRKDIEKGLGILTDVMLSPAFPEDEVKKLIQQNIDGIVAAKDQAEGVIGLYFNGYLYGKHPYGRPSSGDEKSLASITRDDVLKYYQTYYTPSNTILAVVGDIDPAEMEKLLSDRFGSWPSKTPPAVNLSDAAPEQGRRLLLVDKPDSTQTYYQIGNIGIARTNEDRVYLHVVNTLFGGRFTSMLNDGLRVSSGLTYGARSYFDERKARGPFLITTFTSNETTEKAIDLTLEILKRLHESGLTEAQLKSAKAYIKGQFPLELETNDQLAGLIARLEFYGLDERDINEYYTRIDAMTTADAQRVIKQYFPLENLVFVLIGKSSEIEKIARKYATKIDTKSISQPGF
ncbi:MAG: insulinase family protein [Blastocatellia bacterium]|nr:insulinase family protein [Blastocatellia bacterium]